MTLHAHSRDVSYIQFDASAMHADVTESQMWAKLIKKRGHAYFSNSRTRARSESASGRR